MATEASLSSADMLAHMEVPGEAGAYLLGSLERRITLYSQQVRALNLVYALFIESRIVAGQHAAVIGGGAAGMTAAAALALSGCRVTLFEKEGDLLHLQWGCDKRWVHPHVYDWPAPGALDERAGLPVLPWIAGTAASVAEQIGAAWSVIAESRADLVTIHKGVNTIRLLVNSGGAKTRRLSWNPGNEMMDFNAVIFAVGFGIEKTIAPLPEYSYWRDDRLAQDDIGAAKKYLVSGTGDGGLTDVLRASIKRFRHHELVNEFDLDPTRNPAAAEVANQLRIIEAEALRLEASAAAEFITVEYKKLASFSSFVDSKLAARLTNRTVTLHGRGAYSLSLEASILSRYLASRLIALHAVDYWFGPLERGSIVVREKSGWRVKVEGETREFDEVVIRHGTTPALDAFPKIAELCRAVRRPRNAIDQSRTPMWPADWLRLEMPHQAESGRASQVAPMRGNAFSPSNRISNVPYNAKRGRVIGRENLLDEVRKQLTSGRRTAIGQTASFQGLGGLGKTQLAVEYTDQYGDEYPNGVLWIDADRDIDAQLVQIADEAKWIAPSSEHSVKLDVALHRLRTYSDALIVFDNLVDREAIEQYLPEPGTNVHILVTSRTEQTGFEPVPLDLLGPLESLTLLEQEAGRWPDSDDEKTAASEISERLGGLPLALELAGAYLHHRPAIGWRQYQQLLDNSIKAALAGKFLDSFTKHDKDLYATLRVTEDVFGEEPILREILDVLSASGPASMSLSLLGALLNRGEMQLFSPLSLGVKLRLLRKEDDSSVTHNHERYRIHRLVQEVRREEIVVIGRSEWLREISRRLGAWFEQRRQELESLPIFESEFDHLRVWQHRAVESRWPEKAHLTWLQAYPSFHRARYRESRQWVEQAQRYYAEAPNDATLEANLWSDQGSLALMLGEADKALEYAERALELRCKCFGEDHIDTATSFNNVASAYSRLAQYPKALEFNEHALAIRRRLFGEEHRDTAQSLNNLGGLYIDLGKHQAALELVQRALAIVKKVFGNEHPSTATAILNLGAMYSSLGEARKALEFREQALDLRRKLLGEEHPDTASSLSAVGVSHYDLGNHRKALELEKCALELRQKVFGDDHPDTATSLSNLGSTYLKLGEHQTALAFAQHALEIRQRILGDSHPMTATSLNNVGAVYDGLREHRTALEFAQRTLEIRERVFGKEHPIVADSLSNVGAARSNLLEHRTAASYAQQALEIRRKVLGGHHPDTIASILTVSAYLAKLGNFHGARVLLDATLSHLPRQHASYTAVNDLRRKLPVPRGFRTPPATGKRSKKKTQ